MTRFRIAALVLCVALLFLLTGCFASDHTDKNQTTALTADSAAISLYQQAADKISTADNFSLYIGTITNTTVGGQTFSKSSQQLLDFQNYGTNAMQASMVESLHIGIYNISISEFYGDGIGYFTVNNNSFTAPMTVEEYCIRYAPAVLFNTVLYRDIQTYAYGKATGITFRQPAGAESWAIPTDAEFTDASGYAVLDHSGALKESTYTVTYQLGAAFISQTTRVIVRSASAAQVKSPGDASSYTSVEYLDAPRKLEEACGYLLQANQIQSTAVENITCQAFAINRSQTTSLTMSGAADTFNALLDINVNQINESRGGEVTAIQQTEGFQNGVYSISINGSASTTNASVDYKSMQTYCQNLLVESILLTEYIAGASLLQTENTYRITFRGSEALAEAICRDICSTLYNDPTLLNTLASAYTIDTVECYLELDSSTGLPTASGLRCRVTHTIEKISYLLTTQMDQIYHYQ